MPVDTSPPELLWRWAPDEPSEQRPDGLNLFPVLVAAAVAIGGLLPWEEWCDGVTGRCFTARIWGGSASLLGLLAEIVAVAFVCLAVARRWWRRPLLSWGIALFAGTLGLVIAKWTITFADQTSAASENYGTTLAAAGTWLGLSLAIVGVIVLTVACARTGMRLRTAIALVLAVAVVVALGVPYAKSGLAWWGGPLANPKFIGGGNGAGYRVEPGLVFTFGSLLYFGDDGHFTTTMNDVSLIDATPGLRVLGTYVETPHPCTSAALKLPGNPSNGCDYPLQGFKVRPGSGDEVVMTMVASRPGVYRVGWFRIGYHVGPIGFEIFRTDQLVVCVPEPGKKGCPGSGLSPG